MAAVALSNSVNRTADFDAGTGYSTTNIGGGAAPGQETVTFYEGTASLSRKCVNSVDNGWWVNLTTSVDMTAGDDKVWLAKVYLSDNADLNSTGFRLRIGSATTAYYTYLIHDDGTLAVGQWPSTRAWLIVPIDPNVSAFHYATTGSPSLTAANEFAITSALVNGNAKSENLFLDEIDLSDGLYLVGGDGANTDAVFSDFVDYDEGTQANRWGHVITQEGIIYHVGKLIIGRTSAGTATATVFQDTGSVLVCPESLTDAGWNELEFDISNATTDIDLIDGVYQGRGTGTNKIRFNTETQVDGTGEDITLTGFQGTLRTGDAVLYSNEGGTETIGLTNNTEYWVFETTTAGDFTIHTSYAAGLAGTGAVNLTASTAGNGESHSFQKQPDTRPDFTVTGTSGSFDASGITLDNYRAITLTSGATLLNTKLLNCDSLSLSTGTLNGVTVAGATTDDGEAFITTSTLANISNSDFTHSDGHAIEITATGTYTFTNNTFTGYSGTPGDNLVSNSGSTDAMIYNNSGGLVTINVSGGTTVSVRNGAGATTEVNNNVNVTFTGMKDNTEVRVYRTSDGSVVGGIENATAGTTDDRSFTWSDSAGTSVYYVIHNVTYETIRVEGFTVPATNTSIPIQQRFDRNNFNPD